MQIDRVIQELQKARDMGAETVCVRVTECDECDATSEITDVNVKRSTKTVILVGNLDEAGGEDSRDSAGF
jgi:hypothetical protein